MPTLGIEPRLTVQEKCKRLRLPIGFQPPRNFDTFRNEMNRKKSCAESKFVVSYLLLCRTMIDEMEYLIR